MGLVSVKSWEFAPQYGLNERLLHFIASITSHISETKDRCEPQSTLKIRKICLVQVFGVFFVGFFFIESITGIIAHPPQGTPREVTDESPTDSFVAPS